MSNCSSRKALIVLNAQGTSGAIGATDPFAVVGILIPKGVTPVSGGGPSQGPSTLTEWPKLLNIFAKPKTCPWTPPGTVRL